MALSLHHVPSIPLTFPKRIREKARVKSRPLDPGYIPSFHFIPLFRTSFTLFYSFRNPSVSRSYLSTGLFLGNDNEMEWNVSDKGNRDRGKVRTLGRMDDVTD